MSITAQSVLVVDDDKVLSQLLADVLHEAGHDVVRCHTAGAARSLLAERNFDLALLDIGLPDGNGLEVLRSCAPARPYTRFVIMTGDESPANVLHAIRAEAYGYLRKPFHAHDLRELVDEWLGAAPDQRIEVHSATAEWIELSLPCTRCVAERIAHFMRHLDADLPLELRDDVADCFRELVMNAVEWGGCFDPSRRVRVAYVRGHGILMYRIADPGRGFSFERLQHAAIGNDSADPLAYAQVREAKGLRGGGLGLVLVRSRADELIYNEAQNEVLFIKYLKSE